MTNSRSIPGLIAAASFASLGLLCCHYLVAQSPESPGVTSGITVKGKDRVREGTTLVNVLGSFRLTGDRATFYPADGSGKFGGLENLTLERVANVIGEDPTPVEWLVSGTVTEYKGNNYILVTRAILKSKPTIGKKALTKSQP